MATNFGKYTLLKKIATGGMAEIYIAQFTSIEGFRKRLVIKKILPKFASERKFISMFIEEAKVVVNFNHRNIVQVFDFGKIDGEYYIAMEYVEGFDLLRLFTYYKYNRDKINIKAIIYILLEILKGLNYAHNKSENDSFQLVHRDISLNNVILSRHGDVKLLDFGIAKTGPLIHGDDVKGKIAYMAPEQLKKEDLDGRVDIYGTGMLGWRLLTGEKPFDTKEHKTIDAVLSVTIPPLLSLNEKLPPELVAIIEKATARDRDCRYSQALDFYEALYQYASKNNLMYDALQFTQYVRTLHPILFKKLDLDDSHEFKTDQITRKKGETDHTTMTTHEKSLTLLQKKQTYLNGEQKVVNFIYADFKEIDTIFTQLSVQRFERLMHDFFKVVKNIVYKYQCSILFLDHYGMAFIFGAPTSREDDAIQAVRFAIDLKEAFYAYMNDFKLETTLSIVINRGLIIVNRIHSNMFIEMIPVKHFLKDTRKLGEESPGGIYVTRQLRSSIEQVFHIKEEKKLLQVLKQRKIERFTANKLFGVETKFIGRQGIYKTIQERLNTQLITRSEETILLIGEAGIGKSRFVFELLRELKQNHTAPLIIKGRSLSYEGDAPFYVIINALKEFLNLSDTQNKRFFEKQIKPYLKLIKTDPIREELMVLVGHFIGLNYRDHPYLKQLQEDPKLLKNVAIGAVKRFLQAIAQDGLLLIFEDIHWASEETLALIHTLPENFKDLPVTILLIARESLLQRDNSFNGDTYQTIKLPKLSEDEGIALLKSILIGIESVPKKIYKEIYEKASGIPFFMEEIIKMFIEQKIIYPNGKKIIFDHTKYHLISIPASVESILRARLDALTPDEKSFIQKASVVGRVFWTGVIKALTSLEERDEEKFNYRYILNHLEENELVFKKGYQDNELHEACIFKHALLKDVAYQSMIGREKQHYHRQTALFLEKYSGDAIQNINHLIAYHYESALDTEKAALFFFKAGEHAAQSGWLKEAINVLKKAVKLLTSHKLFDHKLYCQLSLKLAQTYREMGQYQHNKRHLDQLKQFLFNHQEYKQYLFKLYLEYFQYYEIIGDFSHSLLVINIAKDFTDDVDTHISLLHHESYLYYRQNRLKKAFIFTHKLINLIDQNSDLVTDERRADAFKMVAILHAEQGSFDDAITYFEKSIQLYIQKKYLYKTATALNNLAETYKRMGNVVLARSYYKRALDLNNKSGNPFVRAILSNNIGELELREHNYSGAIKLLKYAIDILDQLNVISFRYETHRLLAEAYFYSGEYEACEKECAYSEEYSLKARNNQNLILLFLFQGDTANYFKQDKEAEGFYQKALNLSISMDLVNLQLLTYKKLVDFHRVHHPDLKDHYLEAYFHLKEEQI